ncbi:hypothetical protein LZ30DRAFT_692201 [Colletotrichum cereale]|nr:hypothetical protein LZ30DRAFT_692201 [Colletotrichum cereale]
MGKLRFWSSLYLPFPSCCLVIIPSHVKVYSHSSRSSSYQNRVPSVVSSAHIDPSNLLPMAGSDRRRLAKELVHGIAKEHDYVAEETLQNITNPEARREIETALHNKDVVAKNLYTSKARFIFELLQNVDDNQYSRAAASGSYPFVSFRVFPHRSIIKWNENDFTHENLIAICSVGQSSKTGPQGRIGEKGVGLKSVFMVAWKAHIQSGILSFTFRHKKGESGMCMITPVWKKTDEVLKPPLTRITLYLLDTEDSNAVAETQEAIRTQFDELRETVLLFLESIRKIRVDFYDDYGRQTTSVTHARTQLQPDRTRLETYQYHERAATEKNQALSRHARKRDEPCQK